MFAALAAFRAAMRTAMIAAAMPLLAATLMPASAVTLRHYAIIADDMLMICCLRDDGAMLLMARYAIRYADDAFRRAFRRHAALP